MPPNLIASARTLRRNQTDAERAIWFLLRDRRLDGAKFRRQVVIGGFIADFACVSARLVIEIDGGQHGGIKDTARDRALLALGWRTVRFWNNDVLANPDGVAAAILVALAEQKATLTPALSRKRERE